MYGTPDNAGAGLFFTRRMSEVTDRYFAIASGNAMFRTSIAKRRPADQNLILDINPFPGTIVSVEIGLDNTVDFGEFLAEMRQAFTGQDVATRERVQKRVQFS